jgi:hypothetical protein
MKPAYRMLLALQLMIWIPSPGMRAQAEESSGGGDQAAEPLSRLVIVDFRKGMDISAWEIEDDVVMGGRSQGAFSLNENGHAVFSGEVSLENGGGFSSVQHSFDAIDVSQYSSAVLRIKGDGKRYQFLIESERDAPHYYVYEFETTGEWQAVRVPLKEMYPVYRGDRLTIPNYPGETLAMVRLFIANNNPESFHLEIDQIWLE